MAIKSDPLDTCTLSHARVRETFALVGYACPPNAYIVQIGPQEGIEVKDLKELERKIRMFIFSNNLFFGLLEIVEGTFLKLCCETGQITHRQIK